MSAASTQSDILGTVRLPLLPHGPGPPWRLLLTLRPSNRGGHAIASAVFYVMITPDIDTPMDANQDCIAHVTAWVRPGSWQSPFEILKDFETSKRCRRWPLLGMERLRAGFPLKPPGTIWVRSPPRFPSARSTRQIRVNRSPARELARAGAMPLCQHEKRSSTRDKLLPGNRQGRGWFSGRHRNMSWRPGRSYPSKSLTARPAITRHLHRLFRASQSFPRCREGKHRRRSPLPRSRLHPPIQTGAGEPQLLVVPATHSLGPARTHHHWVIFHGTPRRPCHTIYLYIQWFGLNPKYILKKSSTKYSRAVRKGMP